MSPKLPAWSVLAVALLLAAPRVVRASPGDPSVATGGTVTTAFAYAANAVALQEDGKIVAAGGACGLDCEFGAFALARYNPDGSLDATFGTGGTVTTAVGTAYNVARAIALQGDGKIVAAGSAANSFFALARYNPDGSLDATFGMGGKVTMAVGYYAGDPANAVVLQRDGKIVAGGYAFNGDNVSNFALARYNPDGRLDTTFGTGGTVTTSAANSNADYWGTAILLQGDGKIVTAGWVEFTFALARYNPDGSLDATFGTGGTVTTIVSTDSSEHNDSANALALQRDGKIVAAGASGTGGFTQFALARYNPDGSLDATFGTTTTTLTGSTVTTTTTTMPPTTTTLPCTTARCTLGAAVMSPACAGQTIPPSVTGKLTKAANFIDQAAASPAKKARKLLKRAKKALKQAEANATRAAKGKKLSSDCAAALKSAADGVLAGLGV